MIGAVLSHYRVTGRLGQGGMGEVYRAVDEQLGREVAVKVLPEEVGRDPERLARFRREAQVLASLNHPGIAAIHGLEEADGRPFLVLELVEGEDLAERLTRGPLPVDEALEVGRQVAEALEEAHERGVVHRDLKPANVKLRADGRAKVLDFGLAKAFGGEGGDPEPDVSQSPTLPNQATHAGVILGTAPYMSPEQARGRAVDKRTDVWAFGAVLVEMLTGRRLFEGETVTDVLAAVVRDPIDLDGVPPLPSGVRRLIGRCLERDPRRRLRDVGEARIALEEALAGAGADEPAVAAPRSTGTPWLPWALAALGIAAAAWATWRAGTAAPAPVPLRAFDLTLGDDQQLPRDELPVVALSDDGSTLVYTVVSGRERRLYRRRLDDVTPRPIPGSEGATGPFLSPDARWVGFFAEGELRRVPIEGGTPTRLAAAPNPRGAVWHPDGSILFVPTVTTGIWRVSDTGSEPEPVTTADADRNERTHRWPHLLPDGDHVLFTIGTPDSPGDYDANAIGLVSLATGERRTVFEGARAAFFAAPDVLLAVRRTTLIAAHLDPAAGVASGERVVLGDVGGDASSGAAYLSLSRDGTLAYVPDSGLPDDLGLVLVDGSGAVTPLPLEPAPYFQPRFSPDGTRLAFSIGLGRGVAEDDVWTYDLSTGVLSRLTFEGFRFGPVWSPDGRELAFGAAGGGLEGVHIKHADGSSEERIVWHDRHAVRPNAFTPDGDLVVNQAQPRLRLFRVSVGGDEPDPRLLHPDGTEAMAATLSPDGRLMAYTSTDSGAPEVYVQALSGSRGKWQITHQGGHSPVWSRDGRVIHYITEEGVTRVMAVPVDSSAGLQMGPPREVFSGLYEVRTEPSTNYDVAADGRFVMVRSSHREETARRVNVVLGWGSSGLADDANR